MKKNLNILKEFSAHDALDMVFKELKQESVSILEIKNWKREYNKERLYHYVDITGSGLMGVRSYFYYWDTILDRFFKQMYLKCPICDDDRAKYPLNKTYRQLEKYYKLKNFKVK